MNDMMQRILDLKRFDDPTRPAAYVLPSYDDKVRVAVEPGDGKHYEVRAEGNDVLLMNVGDFVMGNGRCAYIFPWGFQYLDAPQHKMNQHTVAVYRWLTSVAIGSDFIEIPPRWKEHKL
jgi:hypothetical protein